MSFRTYGFFLFCAEKEKKDLNLSAGGADNAAQPSRKACFSARQAKLLRERCDNVATKHEVPNAERLKLAGSKVQTMPQFRYKGIEFFVFMWYNNIVIISYDEGRMLYGKTIFVDNEHRRKHTVLS